MAGARQAEMVALRVLRFPDWPSDLNDEVGLLEFEAICAPLRVASQLHGALRQIRNRIGAVQYEREWRHPFPDELLERLKTVIGRMKGKDAETKKARAHGGPGPVCGKG